MTRLSGERSLGRSGKLEVGPVRRIEGPGRCRLLLRQRPYRVLLGPARDARRAADHPATKEEKTTHSAPLHRSIGEVKQKNLLQRAAVVPWQYAAMNQSQRP